MLAFISSPEQADSHVLFFPLCSQPAYGSVALGHAVSCAYAENLPSKALLTTRFLQHLTASCHSNGLTRDVERQTAVKCCKLALSAECPKVHMAVVHELHHACFCLSCQAAAVRAHAIHTVSHIQAAMHKALARLSLSTVALHTITFTAMHLLHEYCVAGVATPCQAWVLR